MKIPTASASRVVTAVPRNAALFACFALASCAPAPSNVGQGGGASQGQGGGASQGQGGGTSQGQGGGAAGFVIGGTISGLNVSGLTLNGGLAGVVMPDAGDTSFTLPNPLPGGAAYAVQIASLPLGKQCTADNASGTVQRTSVTSIAVTCVGAWTWVSGQSTTNANGVYGVQGVPNAGNYPGARNAAASWVDAKGALWLFGGNGYPADGGLGDLNDLWTYSPTTGQWTWMHGGDTIGASVSYGTLLIPDAGNVPSARSYAQNWLDSQGRLWLFGGTTISIDWEGTPFYNYFNDLWSYSPGNNQWTRVGGTQELNADSIYNTKGLADAGSFPGGRASGATWIDSQGNIWFFGGRGNAYRNYSFSDLWSFSPAATEWTWVGGKSGPNEAPIYGELGVSDAGNSPGARSNTATWTDGHGRLWLFGGTVPAEAYVRGFNDLWNYSTSTKQWTWVGGETTASARGVYGRKLAPDGGNYPRARYEATTWTDSTGKFWLFGGYGEPPDTFDYLYFNDLWHYSPGTNQWTWVDGAQAANQSGIYGVRGVPDAGNSPGARSSASSWADSQGRLWLFGGLGYANGNAYKLNDLWVYTP